jgi:hypothetical protein
VVDQDLDRLLEVRQRNRFRRDRLSLSSQGWYHGDMHYDRQDTYWEGWRWSSGHGFS